MILEVEKITASYGASQILFEISLQVNAGETVCILGRNGVGKTTTLKTVMGILKPTGGSIKYRDANIAGLMPYKINRLGIAYVPQGRHIFSNLTTRENLLIGARKGDNPATEWTLDKIYQLFPVLKNRETFKGLSLSGGEQQMLTIARGLMQNPKLMLLDEICEGLAPMIIKELGDIIRELKKTGVSVLIAEQNVKFAMEVSDSCYILEKGQVVYNGNSAGIPHEVILKHLAT
jgi:branched-chain amino acid transport system ATP-binding protein